MPVSADLGEVLEEYVTELVKSGRYHSKSEVLREGVRLIQEREARMQIIGDALADSRAEALAARLAETEEAIGDLRKRIAGKDMPE